MKESIEAKKGFKIVVIDIVMVALSLMLMIGVKTVFNACAPKEDGSFMSCHWAENTVFAMGIILTVQAVIRMCVNDGKKKQGISLSMLPVAVLSVIVPGNIISLCMMNDMRCHTTMRPAASIVAVLIIIVCGADVVLSSIRDKKNG